MGIPESHPAIALAVARGLLPADTVAPKKTKGKGVKVATAARKPGTDLEAELPLPPSVNNLFITRGNRRVKSPGYRTWLSLVAPILRRLISPNRFPVEIVVTVHGPLNMARDLDNMLKPVGDALVIAEVIPGDSVAHVRRWSIEWARPAPGAEPVAVVRVRTYQPEGV